MDLYAPAVRRWCQRAGLQPADADEVLQEMLLAVRRAVAGFSRQEGSGSFPAWLWTIARGRILDLLRRRGRRPDAVGGSDFLQRLEQEPDPADDSSGRLPPAEVLSPVLRRALDLVSGDFEDRTWRAFWLVVVEEKPAAEAAEQLGTTAGAVRIAKSRVLKRLRQVIGLGDAGRDNS
jgi:RNA polymerase sigma-70 factor (ECF subfamily)